jgi:anti-anti-sigma factor
MSAAVMDEQGPETEAADAPDGLPQLRLTGPLTAATAPMLRARVQDALARGESRLLVDLQGVTGLDAAGIAALLDAHRQLQARTGGTLVLRTNPIVCRALKETGTITVFTGTTGHGM